MDTDHQGRRCRCRLTHGRDARATIDGLQENVSLNWPGKEFTGLAYLAGPERGVVILSQLRTAAMSVSDQTSDTISRGGLANQPFVLLAVAALCWAGNAIVGKVAAGHI